MLALAHKVMEKSFDPVKEREFYENDLEFNGFMVLENKLKEDTLEEVRILKKAKF